jgi:ankyrin repeat protein
MWFWRSKHTQLIKAVRSGNEQDVVAALCFFDPPSATTDVSSTIHQKIEHILWRRLIRKVFGFFGPSRRSTINTQDKSGWTALLWAIASNSDLEIVKLLVEAGADVNLSDNRLTTPLMRACRPKDISCVQYLIEKGADISHRDDKGRTALLFTCEGIVSLDLIGLLIEKGADVNTSDMNGATPLMLASRFGHRELVIYLLQKGADARVQDREGNTALSRALFNVNHQVFQEEDFLVVAYMSGYPQPKRRSMFSSFHRSEGARIIDALIRHQVQTYEVGSDGRTLLMLAVMGYASVDLLNNLLDQTDIDALDICGSTALMYAAQNGNNEAVRVLLEAGASMEYRGFRGETHGKNAEGLAADNNHAECALLLRVARERLLLRASSGLSMKNFSYSEPTSSPPVRTRRL